LQQLYLQVPARLAGIQSYICHAAAGLDLLLLFEEITGIAHERGTSISHVHLLFQPFWGELSYIGMNDTFAGITYCGRIQYQPHSEPSAIFRAAVGEKMSYRHR